MGKIENISQILITYLPIIIPSIGLKVFVSPIYEEVGNWIIALWLVFPILAIVQIYCGLSFISLIGYVILAKIIFIATSKKNYSRFSYMTFFVGLGAFISYLYFRGFEFRGITYPFDILGVSLVVAFAPSTAGVSELLLALSFISVVLPNDIGVVIYPIVLLSAIAVAMKNFFMWMLGNDKITFARKVRFLTIIMTILVVSLVLITVLSSISTYMENISKNEMKEHIRLINITLHEIIKGKSLDEILKDDEFLSFVSGSLKPSFLKSVYITDGRRKFVFGEPIKSIDQEKYYTTSFKENGYEIFVVYNDLLYEYHTLFISKLFIILGLTVGSLIFGFWINSIIWISTMDREIEAKTENLNAANEELSAMNEELIKMNEELSKVYSDLARLNRGTLNFLNFVKSVDIRESSEKIFEETYKVISGTLGRRPIGYKVVDSDGDIIRSYGDESNFYVSLKIGKLSMKIYYSESLELSEDELIFVDIVSSIGTIMIYAHENYISVEKSKLFLSKVLNLLDMILLSNSKEKIEEIILRHAFDLFEDTCTVAIGWLDDFEDGVLTVKYLNDRSEDVKIKRLVERGIMKYALTKGEEYIVRNVFEDDVYLRSSDSSRSAVALPLKTDKGVIGVIEIDRSNFNAFTEEDLKILRIFARIVAIAFQRLKYYQDLKNTLLDTIEALSYAIELKDPYTKGHSRRVANYSIAIAKAMGLPRERIETIEIAALLHDIGKIGIRGSVLNKPSRLTKDEYEEIMKHPVLGEELVKRIRNFKHIAIIIRHHHEFYGGGGYPDGLKGEEIPLESRIIAVADAFDAMTSDRPYRKALSVKRALEILEKNERKQWDPKIVKIAVKVFKELFSEELENEDSPSEE